MSTTATNKNRNRTYSRSTGNVVDISELSLEEQVRVLKEKIQKRNTRLAKRHRAAKHLAAAAKQTSETVRADYTAKLITLLNHNEQGVLPTSKRNTNVTQLNRSSTGSIIQPIKLFFFTLLFI